MPWSSAIRSSNTFYSAQNVAVTGTGNGKRKMLCQDIRNDNGRCIKSRDMFKHRRFLRRPGQLIWLQKDQSLPPVMKVSDLGAGRCHGRVALHPARQGRGERRQKELAKLVIEPFANPFRVHKLMEDCRQFLKLFKAGSECYIMNTHAFGIPGEQVDIPKGLSLKIVTELVRGNIEWREWRRFQGLSLPKNGNELFGSDYDRKYKPTQDLRYLEYLRDRMQDRITYLSNKRDLERDMESSFIDPLVVARTVIDKILNPV